MNIILLCTSAYLLWHYLESCLDLHRIHRNLQTPWMGKTRFQHLEKFYKKKQAPKRPHGPPRHDVITCYHLGCSHFEADRYHIDLFKYFPIPLAPINASTWDTLRQHKCRLLRYLPFSFKVSLTSQSIVCGPSSYMPLPASWWLVRWQVTWHDKECKLQDSVQGGVGVPGKPHMKGPFTSEVGDFFRATRFEGTIVGPQQEQLPPTSWSSFRCFY